LIKAVIFDIGGVVIEDPMNHIYTAVGRKSRISKDRVKRNYYKLRTSAETGKISSREFWMRLSKGLKISDVGLLEKAWMGTLKKVKLNSGVVKIINSVKRGYKVATLSNTMEPHAKFHKRAGHYKFFPNVFLSYRLGIRKPDIRIYNYVIKKLKVKPSECVFIDDMPENVTSARKAGMKAIIFRNVSQLEKDLKKHL